MNPVKLALPAACLGLALLASCATTPNLDTEGVDATLNPQSPTERLDLARGRRVHWGGVVISSENLAEATQVEVLGYPLDNNGRPDLDAKPIGRFLAVKPGYLETLEFARGRVVSFVGALDPTRAGRIGDSDYRYPVLRVEQAAAWQPARGSSTRFHIGIGIRLD